MASVALLTVTGILSQAVGFAYRVGLTRLAGAEIMGLYQLILPVYSILLSLTSVGLTTGVSNLSAVAGERPLTSERTKVARRTISANSVMAAGKTRPVP